MTSLDIQPRPQIAPVLPRIALLTSLRVPPVVPAHLISRVSDIDPLDEVVLLYGPGMGRVAAALTAARSGGERVPPVMVVAPELNSADVVRAFGAGPVSYCLEEARQVALVDLLRLTARGQCVLHPDVLRLYLGRGAPRPDRAAPPPATEPLTARERDIMSLLAEGDDVAAIARRLLLSQKTVRNNLTRIFTKLQVRRQTEAVLRWRGLV